MAEGIQQDGIFAFHIINNKEIPASWTDAEYYKQKAITSRETIVTPSGNIDLIVFNHAPITDLQLQNIRDFISHPPQENFITKSGVTAILINDEVPPGAPQDQDAGLGLQYGDYILLTSKAYDRIPHRVSEKVDRIRGTLVHECMEGILKKPGGMEFINEWAREFGYDVNQQLTDFLSTKQPELCVTAYATQAPNEDICDSAVALFFDSGKLHPAKAVKLTAFLQKDNSRK